MFEKTARRTILILTLSVTTAFLGGCGGGGGSSSDSGQVDAASLDASIPELAAWKDHMISFGHENCQALVSKAGSEDDLLINTYYDAEWVYYQIASFTGDNSWLNCATAAEGVYRDQYLLANNGQLPGYWVFSHGVTEDYQQTGDQNSKKAVELLSENGAFAQDSIPLAETQGALLSREVAYQIMTNINLEKIGGAHRKRLDDFVEQAYGHLDQWFKTGTAPYVRPFMVSLTAHALIMHFEQTGDPRVVPALATAADWIWDHTWLPQAEAFSYTDRDTSSGGREAAPDLNLLIVPFYGWLYQQTGDEHFRERGNQIFAGGVRQAYLSNGKHFDQNYRWSMRYVAWVSTGRLAKSVAGRSVLALLSPSRLRTARNTVAAGPRFAG